METLGGVWTNLENLDFWDFVKTISNVLARILANLDKCFFGFYGEALVHDRMHHLFKYTHIYVYIVRSSRVYGLGIYP